MLINDSIPTKHLHWENVWNICERAERASFKNLAFSHSITAISLNNLLVLQILCFRNIFNFRCQHSPYIYNHQINAVSFYYSWYGAMYINDQYTDKTLTLRKCMCMRASEASELRKFRYFYILKLLFLRYFVGTSDALSYKWHACRLTCTDKFINVPTNLSMYRQISKCTDKSPKRHYWGAIAPPAPPLATLMWLRFIKPCDILGWSLVSFLLSRPGPDHGPDYLLLSEDLSSFLTFLHNLPFTSSL